jgi:glucose-1-phosphate thymidylyltransferase
MRVFILAGGFATRLWPLTERRAKPLLPLAGKPIISHLVASLPTALQITVSTNDAFATSFQEWMNRCERRGMELVIERTDRDDHKLGALGAVAQWIASEHIDDDLLILTGDNYLGFRMEQFIAAFRGNTLIAAHDIGDRSRAKAFGTVMTAESNGGSLRTVTAFQEKPAEPQSTLVSAGCIILPRSTIPLLLHFAKERPDNLGGIIEELLRKRMPVDCFTFSEPWIDIGSFHSYLDGHTTLVGENTILGEGSVLHQTVTRGSICLGSRCDVTGSQLEDCIIFDDVIIRNCSLRRCIVDHGSRLENVDLQGKMLREETLLVVRT